MSRNPKSENAIGIFVLLIIALLLNVTLINRFLLTLFIGWLIAEIMSPLHSLILRKWRILPGHSALIVTLIATLGIILPLSAMTFFTVQKTSRIVERQLSEGISTDTFAERIWNFSITQRLFDDREEFSKWAKTQGETVVKKIPTLLSGVLATLPRAALQLTLAMLTCFFVIRDGSILGRWLSPKIPLEQATKRHLAKSLTDTAVSSAVATFWAATAQASTLVIAFLALGLPGAPLVFGVSFLCAWFPLLGVTPVWLSATIYLFANGFSGKGFIMLAIGAVSGIVDNIVRPWILKGRSDLHPMISLIVIFGNLEFFGIFGVFTGPVLVKLLIECMEIWARRG